MIAILIVVIAIVDRFNSLKTRLRDKTARNDFNEKNILKLVIFNVVLYFL